MFNRHALSLSTLFLSLIALFSMSYAHADATLAICRGSAEIQGTETPVSVVLRQNSRGYEITYRGPTPFELGEGFKGGFRYTPTDFWEFNESATGARFAYALPEKLRQFSLTIDLDRVNHWSTGFLAIGGHRRFYFQTPLECDALTHL